MARTALVTGGNRGIGQQVARVLAGDGTAGQSPRGLEGEVRV